MEYYEDIFASRQRALAEAETPTRCCANCTYLFYDMCAYAEHEDDKIEDADNNVCARHSFTN